IVLDLGGGVVVHCSKLLLEAGCPPQDPDEVGSSSRARNESASSNKRKSMSPKGVRFGEAVETIGSKYGVGLPLAITFENPRTS
ncbi:hypothetical protein Tco_0297345, partial [Tanacetum coccineum]